MWVLHSDGPPVYRGYGGPWRIATPEEFEREFALVDRSNPGRYRRHAFPSSIMDMQRAALVIHTYWRND